MSFNVLDRILIADDHPFIRRIVREALKGMVDDFIEVGDGEQALLQLGVVLKEPYPKDGALPAKGTYHIAKQAPIDCIITDFHMPHANGLEILRMVRAGLTGVPRDIPAFVLTGFDDSSLLASALCLDVNAFITKPVAKSVLIERITEGVTFPCTLRPADSYASLQLPKMQIAEEAKPEAKAEYSDQPSHAVPKGDGPKSGPAVEDKGIPLAAVSDGSVLEEDLISKDGKLLLSKGHVMTTALVHRLQEISEITGIDRVRIARG